MKPATYSQLYVQFIFAVKNRQAALSEPIRHRVFEYISGIISAMNHKLIIVNGVSDHVHIFLGLKPVMSISELVYQVKRSSSLFINQERLCPGKFSWQEGYGAFSYSRSQVDRVYKYILNQQQHHQKVAFKEEYVGFLERFGIEYDTRYLFNFDI